MYRVKSTDINSFLGEIVWFKYWGWEHLVKARIFNKPGPYCGYNGITIVEEDECPFALYLEEPEDGCSYCGGLDSDWRCEVYVFAKNKGKENNYLQM